MATWVEPTTRLPLRWGRYGDRLGWGLALIVGGTVALAGADTYQLLILLAGTVACAVGWGILPADGWRRLVAALPATLAGWLLLGGPRFVVVLLMPYLCWLLVRHRPPLTLLTALIPLVAAVVIALLITDYSGMLIALGAEALAVVVAAFGARASAALSPSGSPESSA